MIVCWFVGELESHYSVKEAFAALLEVFFVRPYGPQPVPKVPYAFFILQSVSEVHQSKTQASSTVVAVNNGYQFCCGNQIQLLVSA